MPIDNLGQGIGDGTGRKIQDFEDYHRFHLEIVGRVLGKSRSYEWATCPIYFYIDLTAGGGEAMGKSGSPVIAIRNALAAGREFRSYLCERNPVAAYHLGEALDSLGGEAAARTRLFWMDHQESVAEIIEMIEAERRGARAFGLVYADPNGTKMDEEIDTICRLAKAFPKLDALIHLSATTIKRCRTVFGYPSLVERLATIGKANLLVREPCTHHQWTFCFLTDFPDFPAWENRGFYDSRSPAGAALLERLNLPDNERRARNERGERQLRLW